jgi:hypothetical protein
MIQGPARALNPPARFGTQYADILPTHHPKPPRRFQNTLRFDR